MSLLQRSITSSAHNLAANFVVLATGVVGSVLLMRLLPPEAFGAFALAVAIVQLTAVLPSFGFGPAFLNRTSGDNGVTEEILRVHFTLKLLFSLVWAVLLSVGVLLFAPAETRWIFIALIITTFCVMQTTTAVIMLTRQVRLQRLAMAQTISAIARLIIPVALAYYGWGIWALVSGNVVTAGVNILMLYVIAPVWRPRLGWSSALADYFIRFGGKVLGTAVLLEALDRIDDLWTGIYLGDRALGFYTKAYAFATYPRQALTKPLVQVVSGVYAEALHDRQRLSRIFAWVNILMTRANFGIAGLLWLIAPEFIRLILGAAWLPMLDAFRLMLIYIMFDPIKNMITAVLILADASPRLIRARLIQLAVLLVGLFVLGPRFNIAGVALAVNVMIVVGMLILYVEARRFVDFSLWQLLAAPTLALGAGLLAVYGALGMMETAVNDWLSALIKVTLFSLLYAGALLLLERARLRQAFDQIMPVLRRKGL